MTAVFLQNLVLLNGLSYLTSNATNAEFCSQQPLTYADAATNFNLGGYAFGAGTMFGSPTAGSPNGLKVVSPTVTNATIAASGTVNWWAATDHVNGDLLAAVPILPGSVVSAGNSITFQGTIAIPQQNIPGVSLTATSIATTSPVIQFPVLKQTDRLTAVSLSAGSLIFPIPPPVLGVGSAPPVPLTAQSLITGSPLLGVPQHVYVFLSYVVGPPILGVADMPRTINSQTASYHLVTTDDGRILEMNAAGATTVTVDPHSTTAYAAGHETDIMNRGAGTITVAAGAGVTIISAGSKVTLVGAGAGATIYQTGTQDTWILSGALT